MSFGKSFMQMIGVDDSEPMDDISEAEIEKEKQRIANQQRKAKPGGSKATTATPQPPLATESRTVAAPSSSAKMQGYERKERRFTVGGTTAFKLILIEPRSFEECPKLVDSLKGKRPVIINLERLDVEVAKKIFDFLSGATYALDGRVQKVANNIFIFAPANVDIAGGIREDEPENGFETDKPTLTSDSPWGGK
jgi:cell division inhibitor SepF